MPGRRVPPKLQFERPNNQMLQTVESQRVDRCPPSGGDSCDLATSPAKVMIPRLFSRIEQLGCQAGLGITSDLARSFAQRTVDASQGEIAENSRTACNHRNDMIQV